MPESIIAIPETPPPTISTGERKNPTAAENKTLPEMICKTASVREAAVFFMAILFLCVLCPEPAENLPHSRPLFGSDGGRSEFFDFRVVYRRVIHKRYTG